MATFHLPIDRTSETPLHRQIYERIRQAILEGLLRPGQRLPSTRALAMELDVSRLPVLSAYGQLLHEGYLQGRTGSGTYVSGALPDELLFAAARGRPGVGRAIAAAPVPVRDDGGLVPFRVSLPALDQFPHSLWSRLVSKRASALTHAQMAYGDPAGLPVLREAIAGHLRSARAVRCEAGQVMIVSGSQAALRLAASVLLGRGDRVAVEEPGYALARAALSAGGADIAPVPVDGEGLTVDALDRLGSRVRAVYVTPSHQYPLGMSMTATRRLALLEWAVRRNAWVLEDDYDSEYRYVSRPLAALQGMDPHGRVLYIGTFSKVLFPAVRIGYLVVPASLWTRFLDGREAFDLQSPTLYQLVLADFLSAGHFARHLRRMRGTYASRRDALLAGLARHCGTTLEIRNADAGLHVAVQLTNGADDIDLVDRMRQRGLTATALSTCYAGSRRGNGLLLGFGGWTERRLLDATRTLGQLLRERA